MTTVRMKSATFEEFLRLAGPGMPAEGVGYRKTAAGHRIGADEPAESRANLDGWGIVMRRTVFGVGDEVPATVVTRGTDPLVAPDDPAFPGYGSFRVTRNDGSADAGYRPIDAKKPTLPLVGRKEDCHPVQVSLGRYGRLPAGEYNLRFRYQGFEAPTLAIKVYDRPAKR